MTFFKVRSIVLIATLIIGGAILAWANLSVSAQTAIPTLTPNPTITSLETKVGGLETEVKLLNERKDVDKQTLENGIQKTLLPVYIWLAILSALGVSSAVGAWVWIKNFIENTKKQVQEETRKKLDHAFYNADPLYYPIYAPEDTEFKIECARLKKLGFRDIRPYRGLRPSLLDGILIYRVPGKNYEIAEDRTHAESALKTLEEFMVANEYTKKNAAIVLYIAGAGRLPIANEFAASYDNVVIANMPVTIAEHIYALVRGLTVIETPRKETA